MFTRTSNFTYGNYQIANIQEGGDSLNLALKIHIQKYDSNCLRELLGITTYSGLMDNVEDDGEGYYKIKEAAKDTKWDWLLNGKTYNSYAWSGLIKKVAKVAEADIYETMMAPYVFFFWSLNNRTLNLGTGEGRLDSKSATQESSRNKRVDAWNEFVQWAYFGYSSTDVSLMSFLETYKDDFPDVKPFALNTMTYYDI